MDQRGKIKIPARRRCPRCGQLWPQLAARYCFDCEHQGELPLGVTTAGRHRRGGRASDPLARDDLYDLSDDEE